MKQAKHFRQIVLPIILTFLILSTHVLIANTADFIIFHTSDVHGNISSYVDTSPTNTTQRKIGGYSTLKKLMNDLSAKPEAQNARILYFDSGDIFQGTPIVDRTKGSVMIDINNQIGLDAITLGNHEFDYGYPQLQKQMYAAKFKVLNTNVIEKQSGMIPDFSIPYTIYSYNGVRIALTAATTVTTPQISFQKNVEDLIFKDPVPIIQKLVNTFKRANIDYIILLSHLGIDDDLIFAQKVEGVDLILGGHSHSRTEEITWAPPHNTAIIHSGPYLESASVVRLSITKGLTSTISFENIMLHEDIIGYDQEVRDIEDAYLKDLRELMNTIIGEAQINLYRGVSGGDSPAGSLVAESMLAAVDADFAFINFGGVREPIIKGPITMEQIFKIQPFDNYIEVLEMTGKELITLVEQSLSNPFVEIGPNDAEYIQGNFVTTGYRRVVQIPFGYMLPANLKIHFDPFLPPMQRITNITDDSDKPIDENKIYRVAINDFIGDGGDGYESLRHHTNRHLSDVMVRDAIISYVKAKKTIKVSPIRRIFNKRLVEPQYN